MADITYSLVLPAYHEEENLRILLPRIKNVIESLPGKWELVVVDTPQPLDATESACSDFQVRYVKRAPTSSFGDAVRTGIREAQGQWIVFMDADGSHTPEFLPRLVEQSASYDIVIASRYVEGGYTENKIPLVLMSRLLNWTYSIVLGLSCRDVSNSFKIYRSELLKPLALKCHNFDIIEEILVRIVRNEPAVRIKEVPFSFKKRMFGETKRSLFLFMLSYVVTMIRLRFSVAK
jgi:dolichol-phosphate mannosyltransferase